jgi:hypothetical protein
MNPNWNLKLQANQSLTRKNAKTQKPEVHHIPEFLSFRVSPSDSSRVTSLFFFWFLMFKKNGNRKRETSQKRMPSTRCLRNAKKAVVIPAKSDLSLFQKRGGSIEVLPMSLFRIVQENLSQKDYQNLMNANLSTFQTVKAMTVNFSLLGPDQWDRIDICADANKEEFVQQIINSVENKSRQITMVIQSPTQHLLLKYAHLFQGIRKLVIMPPPRKGFVPLPRKPFKTNFPFHIFDGIRHLVLNSIKNIKIVALELPGTEILELNDCGFHEITAWNEDKSLRRLLLHSCHSLTKIPPLDEISFISLHRCFNLLEVSSTGSHKEFALCSGFAPAMGQMVTQQSFHKDLVILKLECIFPEGFRNFTFLQRIPVVELVQQLDSQRVIQYLPFPVFYGKEIILQHFSVGAWNGQMFPNLKKCSLNDCRDLDQLPGMPNIESLSLTACNKLTILPSMPTLLKLALQNCSSLLFLGRCPQLKELTLERCLATIFGDPKAFTSVRMVNLSDCPITYTAEFKQAQHLVIENCSYLQDLDAISGKKTVRLSRLTQFSSLPQCHHIYHLELVNLLNLSPNCRGIRNIHHLTISNCGITTTEGLEEITGSLTVDHCTGLKSLVGLKNIPDVNIDSCYSVNDIIGLGNHQILRIGWNILFSRYLTEFQKEKKHSDIFGSIQQLHFQNQKIW